jgi:hypothetical protein
MAAGAPEQGDPGGRRPTPRSIFSQVLDEFVVEGLDLDRQIDGVFDLS